MRHHKKKKKKPKTGQKREKIRTGSRSFVSGVNVKFNFEVNTFVLLVAACPFCFFFFLAALSCHSRRQSACLCNALGVGIALL